MYQLHKLLLQDQLNLLTGTQSQANLVWVAKHFKKAPFDTGAFRGHSQNVPMASNISGTVESRRKHLRSS